MKRMSVFFVLFVTIVLAFFAACDKKPTAPKVDNPFDPANVQTEGDPFKLTAKIANGGILLQWSKPPMKNLNSFNIYRSEQEKGIYKKIKNISANTNNFTDTNIENGHSYWYVVTAVNDKGQESSRTNITPVNIKTQPVLVINGGAQYTKTRQVNLTILAATANQMMLANKADFSGAQWEAYASSKNWTLPIGDGEKTVYLKVKYDNDQESNAVNAKIIMDTTPPTIDLTVTPDSGITGETSFQIDPTGSRDNITAKNDLLVRYDWDNDGTFDTQWMELQITNYEFQIGGGDKTVKMQLKDGAGWLVETTKDIFVNTRPHAAFTTKRDNNNYLLYHFDASASYDYEDGKNIDYRWDFDGDGVWDTNWLSQDTISHIYAREGSYHVTLSARDQQQITSLKGKTITLTSISQLKGKYPVLLQPLSESQPEGIFALHNDSLVFIDSNYKENFIIDLNKNGIISLENYNNGFLLGLCSPNWPRRVVYLDTSTGVMKDLVLYFDGISSIKAAPKGYGSYSGKIFISEPGNADVIVNDGIYRDGIIMFDPVTNEATQFYDGPNSAIKIYEAKDMTFAPENFGNYRNLMFVLDENKNWPSLDNHQIVIIHPDKKAELFFDLSLFGHYKYVNAMDFTPDGTYLFVATNNSIYKIDASGNYELFKTGFQGIIDLEFDNAGNLFVYDSITETLKIFY